MIRQSLTAYGTPLVETRGSRCPSRTAAKCCCSVHACGVCHSDLHLQDGHFDLGDGKQLDIRSRPQPALHARP